MLKSICVWYTMKIKDLEGVMVVGLDLDDARIGVYPYS